MPRRYLRSGPGRFRPRQTRRLNAVVSKQMSVMRNPFSLSTNNPKIPDGKCQLSSGQRFQAIRQFVNDASSTMTFILYPGLGSGVLVTGSANPDNDSYHNILRYSSHGGLTLAGDITAGGASLSATDDVGEMAKWRVVSQGMRLTLLNNAEENDGYFETCRLTTSRQPTEWQMIGADSSGIPVQSDVTYVAPKTNGDSVMNVSLDNLIDHPTYRTGKLRDLHKHTFNLAAESQDHDFRNVEDTYFPDGATDVVSATGTLLDSPAAHRLVDNHTDETFDIIVVRIHGRTAAGEPSRILCHLTSNQEVCYENGAPLARFHSETSQKLPTYSGKSYSSYAAAANARHIARRGGFYSSRRHFRRRLY